MDATAEVQIKTSNYTADSGSYGYGMVNVVTKTGGNEFHGDLYEINGVAAVDAQKLLRQPARAVQAEYFRLHDRRAGLHPAPLQSDKSKTFFFVSEGWNRRQGPQLVNFTSPPQSTFTAQTVDRCSQRAGNFSGLTAAVKDPTTGQPFPGNIIPANRIDPNATILLSRFYPLPNRTGSPNFVTTPDSASDWHEDLFRVDQMFSQIFDSHPSLRAGQLEPGPGHLQPSRFNFPTGPGFIGKPGLQRHRPPHLDRESDHGQRVHLRLLAQRHHRNSPVLSAVSRTGLNIPEVFPGNKYNAIPIVTLTGYGGIGVGGLTNNANNVYEWKDDLTHVAGNHSLKFGFDFLRIQKFSLRADKPKARSPSTAAVTGNAVADMLLGDGFNYTESSLAPNGYLFANTYEIYAQDDWKIRPNLTVNLGLRWTIFATAPARYDKYNRSPISARSCTSRRSAGGECRRIADSRHRRSAERHLHADEPART